MLPDVEVEDAPTVMTDDEEAVQEADGRDSHALTRTCHMWIGVADVQY